MPSTVLLADLAIILYSYKLSMPFPGLTSFHTAPTGSLDFNKVYLIGTNAEPLLPVFTYKRYRFDHVYILNKERH